MSNDLRRMPTTFRAGLGRLLAYLTMFAAPLAAASGGDVWTYHNDNARTGQMLDETILTPATVKAKFGKLFSQNVDGFVFAQPLYLAGITVLGKGKHNVVFIATEHDSVYAFDADDANGPNATPLWHASFINPPAGVTTVPANLPRAGENDVNSFDIIPEIGITGTPVIDVPEGTLYVIAKTKELTSDGPPGAPQNVHFIHRLHALDVASGVEKFGGPAMIADTIHNAGKPPVFVSGPRVVGTGESQDGRGNVAFDSLFQHQRAGLVLAGGIVYVPWASHGDTPPYHGWLTGFDAKTLKPAGVFNTTPNAATPILPGPPAGPDMAHLAGGAIWQSGGAPAADGLGSLFFLTGNGKFDPAEMNFGDSVLRVSTAGGALALADSFTPFDQANLQTVDLDLGSGGAIILPDQPPPAPKPRLLVAAGKSSTIYVLDRDNLGKFNAVADNQIVQSLPHAIGGGSFGTPAYFNNHVYYHGQVDVLKSFEVKAGKLSAAPVSQGALVYPWPGATPSISANGTSGGIVWEVQTYRPFGGAGKPAILRAYDATDLTVVLYGSDVNPARDKAGDAVKYAVPMVANGKVYVGTQTDVTAFGLLP
jgi:hypothetical protein